MEETTLVRQAQAGQEDAFSQLYETYANKIHGFILSKTLHVPTTEDLTSETFLKALKRLDTFDPEKGKFSTWLFSIARNNVIDHYRKDHPHSNIEDAWDIASKEDVENQTALALSSDLLKNCMKQLSAEEREMITMRFWQDMKYADIAHLLGKTEGSIKMSVRRSIKKLKQAMPEFLTLFILLNSFT